MCRHAVAGGRISRLFSLLILLQSDATAHGTLCTTSLSAHLRTHLQHLQFFVSPLQKLLDLTRVGFGHVLTEGILGATRGVLAEVVCGKLVSLAQELAVLCRDTISFVHFRRRIVVSQDCFFAQDGFRIVVGGAGVPGSGL